MARKRLGEILLERKLITREQLERSLAHQRQTGTRLGAAMVALGIIDEMQLCQALGQALGMRAVRMPPPPEQVDWEALNLLRPDFCLANDVFPLAIHAQDPLRKRLVLAMADPLNIPAIEEIEFTTNLKVIPVLGPLTGVRTAVRRYYYRLLEPTPVESAPDQMTIIRQGGAEQVISTAIFPRARVPGSDVDTTTLTLGQELERSQQERSQDTERRAVADLIRAHAERRRRSSDDPITLNEPLPHGSESPAEVLQRIETRLWALLRILARKGLLTREEFLQELSDKDE